MEKIFKILGIDKLDESKQVEFKTKLDEMIELRIDEKVEEKLNEEKDLLLEKYEMKFEEYKKDITSKFSNFIDSILEEELVIPEHVMEYARKGELYDDLIEQFKIRLSVDEGLLKGEVRSILKEAKEEIIKLKEKVDEEISKNLELQKDAQDLAVALYIRKKCDGLTEAQKMKVMRLLENETEKSSIDKKFDVILESLNISEQEEEENNECVCPECGKMSTVKGACSTEKCPDCDVALKDSTSEEDEEEDKKEDLNESDDVFKKSLLKWKKILKDGKF